MDRERALEQLPETHVSALRLRDRGFDDDAIARALSMAPDAVPAVLQLADEKLAALLGQDGRRPAARDASSRRATSINFEEE